MINVSRTTVAASTGIAMSVENVSLAEVSGEAAVLSDSAAADASPRNREQAVITCTASRVKRRGMERFMKTPIDWGER